MSGSRYIQFVERRELRHKPRPGLWLFAAVGWSLTFIIGVVGFIVFAKHGRDWVLLILPAGAVITVPLALWRRGRDRERRKTWTKPV